MTQHTDRSLLEAALVGYQAQLAHVQVAIADLKKRLGTHRDGHAAAPLATPRTAKRKKHHMSAEGRARIAEAQRKRWAAARKGK